MSNKNLNHIFKTFLVLFIETFYIRDMKAISFRIGHNISVVLCPSKRKRIK